MTRPFSERVGSSEWRTAAVDWIEAQVAAAGRTVTGPVEQPRIRPWSTQLLVPTDAGPLWFKANCRAQEFEPRLQVVLAERVPDAFDTPFAIDDERGWMLTVDRGQVWGEQHEPTLDDWCLVVREAARIQQQLATARDPIVGAGVPDCSPSTVLDRFDRFLHVLADLPDQHPARVPPELAVRLAAARPRLVDAVAVLEDSRLPTTWQHGDLHPWNVFTVGDDLRLFDLGDTQWAHALEILCVPFGWLSQRSTVPWEPVAEAYADAWGVPESLLADDWAAAGLTQGVNRTLTWWVCLEEASAAEWQEWGEGPVYHFSRVADR